MSKTLRPYQKHAVSAALSELGSAKSTLLVLPTGCGKTVVMAKIAAGWNRGNVLLLAHRIELLDQGADKLEAELDSRPIIEQGPRGADESLLWQGGQVIVGSVQTLCGDKRLEKFEKFPFGLIMIDEAHHATSPSYRKVVDRFRQLNPDVRVFGVTATPNRSDEDPLKKVFNSCCYEMGMAEAIDEGWLVRIEQELIGVKGVEWDSIGSGANHLGESDFKQGELEAAMIEEEPLQSVAVPLLEKAGRRQGLVFTAGVEHAHRLAEVLNRRRPGCARAVDGTTEHSKRAEVIAEFHAGRLPFLVNCGVFTEGFDCPGVGLIGMARPTKSVGLYTQMVGRGTRPLPGVVDGPPTAEERIAAIAASAKQDVLVLDFVGNSRHKLVSSVDVLGGNYDLETKELVRERCKEGEAVDVSAELKKAKAETELLREQEQWRRRLKAKVAYTSQRVDPFKSGPGMESPGSAFTRGGSTDPQIAFLVNLGVDRAEASAYTLHEARKAIDDIKGKRPTLKQREVLERFGEPTDVGVDRANEIIRAIQANGWQPLRKEAKA